MIVRFDNLVTEVDAYVNDDKTEVNIYKEKGNWDVFELANVDDFDPIDRTAVVGRYLRTDYRG